MQPAQAATASEVAIQPAIRPGTDAPEDREAPDDPDESADPDSGGSGGRGDAEDGRIGGICGIRADNWRTNGTSEARYGAPPGWRGRVSLLNCLSAPGTRPYPLPGFRRRIVTLRPAGHHNGHVLEMTRDAFEELVSQALDRIPPELTRVMDNVAVFVEDEPDPSDPELLGLYEGTPLTERGEWYAGVLPDRISVYRGPLLRYCETAEEVVHEVAVTVVHEIAHHFGIDDERLHELGWG
jgi:predicted Zn-dependent protease with MMP-like domain